MSTDDKVLVDIYFLVDATGSMTTAIDDVKQDMQNAFAHLQAGNPAWSIGTGLAWYRDVSDGDRDIFDNVLGITTDPDDLAGAVAQLSAAGGGDILESQMYALDVLALQEFISLWRPGSYRYIAWFGDAGGKDPLNYRGGHYTMNMAINELNRKNIKVMAFNVAQSGEGLNYNGQAQAIANSTHGAYQAKVEQRKITRYMYDVIQANLKNTVD